MSNGTNGSGDPRDDAIRLLCHIAQVEWRDGYVVSNNESLVNRTAECMELGVNCRDIQSLVGEDTYDGATAAALLQALRQPQ